jgi:protein-S-isoprenylcysteine O-methyltransferase Ste14
VFLSAIVMFRRFARVLKHAWQEEDFARIAGAAVALVVIGTLTYTLGGDWSVVDGFYFAVATLTTSSIADPKLTIVDPWLKIFTALYVLVGIGILVEVARRLGISFIRVRQQDKDEKAARKAAG